MIVEKNDFRLGLFILGALGILLGLLAFKAAPQVTSRTYPILVRLDDMGGLQLGTQVLLQGYGVGKIEQLQLRREGVEYRVQATLALNQDIQLWEGTTARVVGQGLGSPVLSLVLPDSEHRQQMLKPGSEIEGGLGSSLDHAIAQADVLLENLNASVQELRARFKQKGAGVFLDHPSVALALKDLDAALLEHRELASAGRGLVERSGTSLDHSLKDLEQSLGMVKDLLQKRSGDLDQTLGGLATLTKRLNALTQALQEATTADQPQVAASLVQLRQTLASLEELVNLLKQKPSWVVWGTPTEAAREKAKPAAKPATKPGEKPAEKPPEK